MGTQPSPVHLSKDSGTQPWSSFLELGALHLTAHTNQRHQLPMQTNPSEGTSCSGIHRHHGPLHRRAPQHWHPQHWHPQAPWATPQHWYPQASWATPQHWWAGPGRVLLFTRFRLLPSTSQNNLTKNSKAFCQQGKQRQRSTYPRVHLLSGGADVTPQANCSWPQVTCFLHSKRRGAGRSRHSEKRSHT